MGAKIWMRRSKRSRQYRQNVKRFSMKNLNEESESTQIDAMLADWHKYLDRHKDYPNKDYLWQRWIKT